ncbi:neuronal acetylcholine receptor subunit alpha-3 [Elysia marginata]|uniref:Neuronal acetylcholine receptor subunit alpha-3 n=1 Tax=Elysia marginata TaxID=1093978 RepID=A0AAV4GKU3_9GAST|nr:neuronal acetylcholine receptor subunit alpha-3 [Elysia marginata]
MEIISRFKHHQVFLTVLLFLVLAPIACHAGSYEQMKSIHDTLLASSVYNPFQRPVNDQGSILYVSAMFELVSIVEINDVIQSFKCNGFLGLSWVDERLQWNSSDYGGEYSISPKVTSVFRPQMVLLNTLGDRDLFEDDHAPLTVYSNGRVTWAPGSIFPASCKLDLTQFPYDKQHCEIQMVIMNYDSDELLFVEEDASLGLTFFTQNGLWEIKNLSMSTTIKEVRGDNMPSILINFDLERKPTFLVISILLPTTFLSLLNLLVFLIPVDSGEKISYGITVLLALTVFMSIMSGMLPRSSETMPLVIYYIFILLTISVLTVVDAVIIVRLHHMEEKEERSQKAKSNFKAVLPKLGVLRAAVAPHSDNHNPENPHPARSDGQKGKPLNIDRVTNLKRSKSTISNFTGSKDEPKVNKYKLIGKYIDRVSLVVFGVIWVSVTVGFMAAIMA